MPIYLNGVKYVGGYMNGQRVNGYINGIKLFDYTVNVFVSFSDTDDTQTLYNVPLGNHSTDDLINNHGLHIPDNYGVSSYRVYNIQPNTNSIEVYISPNEVTETVNFTQFGNTIDSTTLSGKYHERENVYPPNNYDFDGNSPYQVIEIDNGTINLNVNYNPPYVPPAPTPASSYTPYIPPASSSSYTPQPAPAPQPQPTMITRPIEWYVPRHESDYVTGGSDTISAPEGTVASLTGLAAMGITISAPDGKEFDNEGNQLHFYDYDQNRPVEIQVK